MSKQHCMCSVDGSSKYVDLRDQQSSGQVSASVGPTELVTSESISQSAVTADLIDLMSSGSPEYRGQLLSAGHLQMRPRPTPPKKTKSCMTAPSVDCFVLSYCTFDIQRYHMVSYL